ncbi:hypothetical protein V6N13_038602 [Hibiscus sabdariffa]|uniref:Uncharacterized protein n=2 Tax=Hibiscus sabdariffa TaxID=183260 RepID=A0ABR2NC20_9ROSI
MCMLIAHLWYLEPCEKVESLVCSFRAVSSRPSIIGETDDEFSSFFAPVDSFQLHIPVPSLWSGVNTRTRSLFKSSPSPALLWSKIKIQSSLAGHLFLIATSTDVTLLFPSVDYTLVQSIGD